MIKNSKKIVSKLFLRAYWAVRETIDTIMRNAKRRPFLCLTGIGVAAGFIAVLSNPLRWPDVLLRRRLLAKVAIGSGVESLHDIGRRCGWGVHTLQEITPITRSMLNIHAKNGSKYAIVNLGKYYNPLRVDVESVWIFDQAGRLMDIEIRRSVDAP